MDLDRIQARIRPRQPWEAVDLGFKMVWAWRGDVYRPWVAACLPVMVVVAALAYKHPILASLMLWWLKPLLDRVLLHTLSRALFAEVPNWRVTLRQVPRLWSGRSILRALLIHRFDLARSFTMPVELLEGLHGPARRARLRVLGRRQKDEAVGLTMVCALAELALTLSLAMLLAVLLPSRLISDPTTETILSLFGEGYAQDLSVLPYLWLVSQVMAVVFLEPFYQSGGLCLYLNRRTQLEAWDIEMAFRRIRARLRAGVRSAATAALGAIIYIMCAFIPCVSAPTVAAEVTPGRWSTEGPADENDPASASEELLPCSLPSCEESRRAIADVVSDPVFGSTQRVTSWRMRPAELSDRSRSGPWLARAGAALGDAIEPVLWAAAVVCLVTFVVLRQRSEGDAELRTGLRLGQPAVVLGLDVRLTSLPADVPAEARRLVALGRSEEAAGLLLRGALVCLSMRERLRLRPSMTEGECVGLVRRSVPPERADYFQSLATVWSATAYGHRQPDPGQFDEMIAGWSSHFQEPV